MGEMNNVWHVEVVTTLFVVAEDRYQAERIGMQYYREERYSDVTASPIDTARRADLESLPWGGDGQSTVRDYLTKSTTGDKTDERG